jgi:hypothetical protein
MQSLVVPELRNVPEFEGFIQTKYTVAELEERAVSYGMVCIAGVNILLSADQHIDKSIFAQAAYTMAQFLEKNLTGYGATLKGALHGRND